jgi:hypothetical protein
MSDILIPLPRDPGHEAMDDTADWAVRRFFPAEASTELGAERSPAPRIPRRSRMGSVGRRQCWLIKHGAALTLGTLVVALAGAAVMGWAR